MRKLKRIYVSYDELYDAYLCCRKRKRGTRNEISFEINENIKLYNLWVELNSGTYVVGKSICFIVKKPVYREVFAADFRDRIVHHLFINRVIRYIEEHEFIEDTYSCRVGKGTLYGINKCEKYIKIASNNYTKECYIIKCDLKSFFVTINKDKLFKKFSEFLSDKCGYTGDDLKFMINLLSLIIYNDPTKDCIIRGNIKDWDKLPKEKSLFYTKPNHGLPIGNLTSQIFANFYLSVIDHYITDELGFGFYGRYVDDFYIIHQDKNRLIEAVALIKQKLNKIECTLHPKKLYLQEVKKGVKFTGAIIKPNRKYISNRSKGNFYDKVRIINEIMTKEIIPYSDMKKYVDSVNSYLGFMKHYATYNIRKAGLSMPDITPFYRFGHTHCGYNVIHLDWKKPEYYNKDYKQTNRIIRTIYI